MRKTKTIAFERLSEVLAYNPDTGVFVWRVRRGRIPEGSPAGVTRSDGYVVIRVDYEMHYAHRLAWLYMTRELVPGIDHINGNPSDNRWANLRTANQSSNSANAKLRSSSTSGYKGVTWAPRVKRWRSSIGHNGKRIWLGYFDTAEEAHAAYLAAARRLFGEYARAA